MAVEGKAFSPIELPEYDPVDGYDIDLVVAAIGEGVPHGQMLTRGPEFVEFGKDTSMESARPEVVVLATEVAHVRHVMHVAHHFHVPIYTRGLGSGLSGGSVPKLGGIVLDVSPMDKLVEVRPGNRSCTVQPGLTVEKLNQQLSEHGLWFPPWPSSHDISSIGGNIAEDAGGITTVKYGTTKHWLLGLSCVLPGGGMLVTGSRAVKDVAGFDLTSLICGSEGMLAVVVEAELKLAPLPGAIGTALYIFPSDAAAIGAAEAVMAGDIQPRTLEYLDAKLVEGVVLQLGDEARDALGKAVGGGFSVLALETDAQTEADALEQLGGIGGVLEQHGGERIGMTTDRAEALRLWRVRSELSPACHQFGEYKINDDICVPRDRMARFVAGVAEIGREFGLEFLNYGHVGDGNFHVTLMFANEEDPRIEQGWQAVEKTCKLALELGGTLTGEHGIGSAKAHLLHLQRDDMFIALCRGIKQAFDPRGIMNPGKWL
jgi:glycolate oxidase subunit GlcD